MPRSSTARKQPNEADGQPNRAGTISANEAREQFSDLLNRAAYAGERIVIERRGKVVAAIIGPADLARLDGAAA